MPKRDLIIFCDGTWRKQEGKKKSLVSLLHDEVFDGGPDKTAILYLNGVGSNWQRVTGGAFGVGVAKLVREGFEWLVRNYSPGDRIYLFGWSRGAFIARSIAGCISYCGIPYDSSQVSNTYKAYRKKDPGLRDGPHWAGVPIQFLGVFDTVGSLGIPTPFGFKWLPQRYSFHNTVLSKNVRHAYHAVALHEKRIDFVPALWSNVQHDENRHQVWFNGWHSDVGGCASEETGLQFFAFDQMVREAAKAGLLFKKSALLHVGKADPNAEMHPVNSFFWKWRGLKKRTIPSTAEMHWSVSKREKGE